MRGWLGRIQGSAKGKTRRPKEPSLPLELKDEAPAPSAWQSWLCCAARLTCRVFALCAWRSPRAKPHEDIALDAITELLGQAAGP